MALLVGKMYRSKYGDSGTVKLIWSEVDSGKGHMLNQMAADRAEIFVFLGNETRTATGSKYMTFLDNRGKVICFGAGARDVDFELVGTSTK